MALISKAEVKEYLKLDPASTLEDNMLDLFIAAAQEGMEAKRMRQFEYATATEYVNGEGETTLHLKRFPIWSVEAVYIVHADNDEHKLSPTAYTIDSRRGLLHGYWNKGIQNYKVVYTAGYWTAETDPPEGVERLPATLKLECLEAVAHMYQNRRGSR